ncbi:hypothetical protein B0T20DRAFT_502128 [Sordaria brevicollis]|uniref:Uncharacterized protein n=1 Tax=Sordaria brevicollis TaxID=83679 RepID=A0AAE0PB45_SORBR|nr:hypothetical protein B0T20DRAFT_502128 [Sordaria brevicollis]
MTDCVDNTGYLSPSDSSNCATMTILDRFPLASQYWLSIGCANPDFQEDTLYRAIDASTTEVSTSLATSTSQLPASTSTESFTEPSDIPPTVIILSSSPQSKAWIAGPISGGIAVLIVLGALFCWCLRRNKKNRAMSEEKNANANNEGTSNGLMTQPEHVPGPGFVGYSPPPGPNTLHQQSPTIQYSPYYPGPNPPQYQNQPQSALPDTIMPNIMTGWEGYGRPEPTGAVSELHSETATAKNQQDVPVILEAPAREQQG